MNQLINPLIRESCEPISEIDIFASQASPAIMTQYLPLPSLPSQQESTSCLAQPPNPPQSPEINIFSCPASPRIKKVRKQCFPQRQYFYQCERCMRELPQNIWNGHGFENMFSRNRHLSHRSFRFGQHFMHRTMHNHKTFAPMQNMLNDDKIRKVARTMRADSL